MPRPSALPPPARPALLPLAVTAAVALGLIALALFVHFHFRAELDTETANDRPFRAPAPRLAPAADGRPPLLAPDPAALRSGAIATAVLAAVRFQPEFPAVGSVVDPVDLAETRAALATAGAARLRREVALARFGPVLAGWMREGSTELDPVLQHRASLLLLTPTPGHPVAAPPAAAVVTDYHGRPAPARLVSVALRADPRFQTLSYFYRADDDPVNPRFVPGMTVSARLAAGPAREGVAVPAAAVVQRDGRAWVYVGETPGAFCRREVSVADALPDGAGWFQEGNPWRTGETVVVAGATLLLASE